MSITLKKWSVSHQNENFSFINWNKLIDWFSLYYVEFIFIHSKGQTCLHFYLFNTKCNIGSLLHYAFSLSFAILQCFLLTIETKTAITWRVLSNNVATFRSEAQQLLINDIFVFFPYIFPHCCVKNTKTKFYLYTGTRTHLLRYLIS